MEIKIKVKHMGTKIQELIDLIKLAGNMSWQAVIKWIVISLILLVGYIGYRWDVGEFAIYSKTAKIEVNSKTKKVVHHIGNKILSIPNVEVLAIYLYQPDGVPKTEVELYTIRISDNIQDTTALSTHIKSYTLDVSAPFFLSFETKERAECSSFNNTYANKVISYYDELVAGTVYVLYNYGSPWGYVLVLRSDDQSAENRRREYNEVKCLNEAIFNN